MHNRTEDLSLDSTEFSIVAQPVTRGVLCAPIRRIMIRRVHRVVRDPAESVHQFGRHDRQSLLHRGDSVVRASCKLDAERRILQPVRDCVAVASNGSGDRFVRAPVEQQLHRLVPARVDVWLVWLASHVLILTNRRGLVDGDRSACGLVTWYP